MKNEELDSYRNKAELIESDHPFEDRTDYECCDEVLAFLMKDKYHEFTIGLSTILHCLAIAEQEGIVPKLPYDWWIKARIN